MSNYVLRNRECPPAFGNRSKVRHGGFALKPTSLNEREHALV